MRTVVIGDPVAWTSVCLSVSLSVCLTGVGLFLFIQQMVPLRCGHYCSHLFLASSAVLTAVNAVKKRRSGARYCIPWEAFVTQVSLLSHRTGDRLFHTVGSSNAATLRCTTDDRFYMQSTQVEDNFISFPTGTPRTSWTSRYAVATLHEYCIHLMWTTNPQTGIWRQLRRVRVMWSVRQDCCHWTCSWSFERAFRLYGSKHSPDCTASRKIFLVKLY